MPPETALNLNQGSFSVHSYYPDQIHWNFRAPRFYPDSSLYPIRVVRMHTEAALFLNSMIFPGVENAFYSFSRFSVFFQAFGNPVICVKLTIKGHLFCNHFPEQNAHCIHITFCISFVVAVIPDFRGYVCHSACLSSRATRCVLSRVCPPLRQAKIR